VLQKVVNILLNRRRDDVATDLGGKLVFILALGDADYRVNGFLNLCVEYFSNKHKQVVG